MWEDMYTGTIYEDEDEARKVALEEMDKWDYLQILEGTLAYEKLFDLVLKYCPDEIFDEITQAEDFYFNERFYEVEEEE